MFRVFAVSWLVLSCLAVSDLVAQEREGNIFFFGEEEPVNLFMPEEGHGWTTKIAQRFAPALNHSHAQIANAPGMTMRTSKLSEEEVKRRKQWHTLRDQIRKSDSQQERERLGKELKDVLEQIFDADLQRRDEQLAKLEERVEELRKAVDRRRENRSRIITVQLDSVILNAEGLNFPGDGRPEARQWHPWAAPKLSRLRASRVGPSPLRSSADATSSLQSNSTASN